MGCDSKSPAVTTSVMSPIASSLFKVGMSPASCVFNICTNFASRPELPTVLSSDDCYKIYNMYMQLIPILCENCVGLCMHVYWYWYMVHYAICVGPMQI